MFDLQPGIVTVVLFAVGWSCGWLLLCRPRRLPAAGAAARDSIAVVIPARNEATVIAALVGVLARQLRPGDELVVVDDHSTDDTARLAAAAGARIVAPSAPPPGWHGKPHACWFGALETHAPILVFLDADVTPGPSLLDDLAGELAVAPAGTLVSVQPWHAVGSAAEQCSLLFNVAALMGVGSFSAVGRRWTARAAFGPVIACTRADYMHAGGHAHPDVRRLVTEDIGLARQFAHRRLFVGSSDGTTFRMFPGGLRDVLHGWTKSVAYGASATHPAMIVPSVGWMWSVAGGWLASPWFYAATVVQLLMLGRIAGGFRPWISVLHPLATFVFVGVLVRSGWRTIRRSPTPWRGRNVAVR